MQYLIRFTPAFLALWLGLSLPVFGQTLETVMVPVDSETALATDVWLPAVEYPDGGWSVILRRTPYGRVMKQSEVAGLLSLGYVFVSQDVRGRGESEGRFLPFLDDAVDGRAAIEWAASQPWSSGRVCLWGGSAEGVVQLMAAGEGPEGLAGAMPMVATDDVREGLMPGGVWRQELTSAWLHGLEATDVEQEWRANEADGPYWDRGRLDEDEMARIDVPIFLIGGFFDIFAHCQPRMHRELRLKVQPGAREDQYLMFGPWTHGGLSFSDDEPVVQGQVEYVHSAAYEQIWVDVIDFLEFVLADGDRPAWAPMRYFRTRLSDDGRRAEGSWRTVNEWPPAGRDVNLYPGPENLLAPDKALTADKRVTVVVNPSSPAPSVGGNNLTTAAGPFNQVDVDDRIEVMYFQTEPLEGPAAVEGDVVAHLRVVFSGTDGDVIVRLSQVTPSGAVMMLSDGAVRARFLADPEEPSAVVPGEPYDIEVRLGPVAVEISAGHSLRMSLSGTSAPRYEPNPGVFSSLAESVEPVTGTLSLVTGESWLRLRLTEGDLWADAEIPEVSESCDEPPVTETVETADRDAHQPVDMSDPESDVSCDVSKCDVVTCEVQTCEEVCPSSGCAAGGGRWPGSVLLILVVVLSFGTAGGVRRRRETV